MMHRGGGAWHSSDVGNGDGDGAIKGGTCALLLVFFYLFLIQSVGAGRSVTRL